ncbi:hypothetical protein Bca4012_051640 [Brassica carinata]
MKYDLTFIDLPTLMPEDTVLDVRKFLVDVKNHPILIHFKAGNPLGIAQHHDCVTGTAKQYVANDYAKRLALAASEVTNVLFKTFLGGISINVVVGSEVTTLKSLEESSSIIITEMPMPINISRSYNNSGLLRSEGYHQSSFVGSYASNYVTGASP